MLDQRNFPHQVTFTLLHLLCSFFPHFPLDSPNSMNCYLVLLSDQWLSPRETEMCKIQFCPQGTQHLEMERKQLRGHRYRWSVRGRKETGCLQLQDKTAGGSLLRRTLLHPSVSGWLGEFSSEVLERARNSFIPQFGLRQQMKQRWKPRLGVIFLLGKT